MKNSNNEPLAACSSVLASAGSPAANADGVGVAGADGSGAMFDAIASRYDALNRILSLGLDGGWRRRAVRAMNLSTRARMLDLATGTADLALTVAKRVPESEIVGVDPSVGMLEVGERKIAQLGLENRITLRQGGAENLPFSDDEFDAVGIAFGIRNVADRRAGLREMSRVTKADGRIVILELGEPTGLLGIGARIYLHQLVPRIGALLSGHREYRYLQRSIAAFPDAQSFARLMTDCDLEVLRVQSLMFGVAHLYVARPGAQVDQGVGNQL